MHRNVVDLTALDRTADRPRSRDACIPCTQRSSNGLWRSCRRRGRPPSSRVTKIQPP